MVKKAKFLHAALAICMILLGIMMILFPTLSVATVTSLFGTFLLICGIIRIMSYFSKDTYNLAFQFDLALGVFLCVIGILLLLHPVDLMVGLPILLGIILLIDGALKLQTALDAKLFGLTKWWLIILLAIVTGCMGIFLMTKPFDSAIILAVLMGVALIIDGVQNLCITIYTVKYLKRDFS